jgi:hypothetical protein
MKTKNSFLERIEVGGRRTRTVILRGSDGKRVFALAVPGKRFRFITDAGL